MVRHLRRRVSNHRKVALCGTIWDHQLIINRCHPGVRLTDGAELPLAVSSPELLLSLNRGEFFLKLLIEQSLLHLSRELDGCASSQR